MISKFSLIASYSTKFDLTEKRKEYNPTIVNTNRMFAVIFLSKLDRKQKKEEEKRG